VFRSESLLPSPKELTQRYGVCYRTLKKALDELVATGLVRPHRRGYLLPAMSGSRRLNTVVLIAGGYSRGELRLVSPRTHHLLRSLETQCSQAGVALEIVPFDLERRALPPSLAAGPKRGGTRAVLGYLLFLAGIPLPSVRQIVARLARTGKQVSVLDESTTVGDAPVFRQPTVRTFAVATNRTANRQIARHLLGLGHRNVAYLSPIADGTWSVDRGVTLEQAFAESGFAGAVTRYVAPASSPTGTLGAAQLPPAIDSNLDRLLALNRAVKALRYQVDLIMQRETVHSNLVPLMEKALADGAGSAWVTANDNIALECMDFLEAHGRHVPQDISVIGYDDNLEAFFRKLTTYNYNATAVIHSMLSHIIDPRPLGRRGPSDGAVEVEGFINNRGTTARPA
jgi:DNA-binding LacI/PurR family transcriptional regulator